MRQRPSAFSQFLSPALRARARLGAIVLALVSGCGGAGAGTSAPSGPTSPVVGQAAAAPPDDKADAEAAVPVTARNPAWGSRTALVTIVEFADFQCPFCARSEPALDRVRAAYGPEVVRIVWKNLPLPFHLHARPAAEAAMGVFALGGNDAFWKFYHSAFQGSAELEAENLERWAKDAGTRDIGAWKAGLDSHAWSAAIDDDLREAQALGVDGTPTFFVNGVAAVGQQSFEDLKSLVDTQLAAAQAKVAAGTPRDHVYAELARENRAKAPKPDEDSEPPEDTRTVFKVPLGQSPWRGGARALVTIIEFADYECPYCARAEATLSAVRKKYGDDLRVVFKDEPLEFHRHAAPAAEAAREVRAEKGDAAFWAMHDELYAHPDALDDDSLVALAVKLGADREAVKAALGKRSHEAEIATDLDVADDFQADGTPHFFINGRRLVGAQPPEKFEAIIDEELKRARGLLATGTKPERLYEALIADGKGPEPPEQRSLPSVPAADPGRGAPPGAPVTVHEWADFQCPFCGHVEPTLQRLMAAYPGKVRIVWHDLPLPMHPDARPAAQAAREALKQKGEAGFWAMHAALFKSQSSLGRSDLDRIASSLRLDMVAWRSALDGATHAAEVGADEATANDAKISGTPSFLFVPRGRATGYILTGAQGYVKFRKLVERSLAEAK